VVSAALLALAVVAAAPPGEAPEEEQSILVDGEYRLQGLLTALPSAGSYHNLLEQVVQPVVFQIEESGGTSDIDPAKLSIYGDSWVWNRWYLDGFDITDPTTSGAPALYVPFGATEALALRYREAPENRREQGVALTLGVMAPQATVRVVAPSVGGRWPLAEPLMDLLSGEHAVERTPPPPAARRGFEDAVEVALQDRLQLRDLELRYAVHAERGVRRFLDFAAGSTPVPEAFARVSGVATLRPARSAWRGTFALEHLQRDRAGAELYVGPAQAATLRRTTAFAGLSRGALRLGLLAQVSLVRPRDRGFTIDLLDPDGEGFRPLYPGGTQAAFSLDAAHRVGPAYLSSTQHLLHFSPEQATWTQPVTVGDEAYGAWAVRAGGTTQAYGDLRLGWSEAFALGPVRLVADLYALGTYGLNRSLTNSLVMVDAGAKVRVEGRDRGAGFAPFLALARTPVAVSPELVRLLDPDHLDARFLLGPQGTLLETEGGAYTRVQGMLSPTDVYSAAAGARWRLWGSARLEVQGLAKAYRDTVRLELDGPPEAFGRSGAGGAFFHTEGPTRFRLVNGTDTPIAYGLHLQLVWHEPAEHLFSVAFSAFGAAGEAPFGNGPTANDVGVVRYDAANPNGAVNALANLDADRGFMVKGVAGYRLWDTLWAVATVRFRDGQPFTFFEAQRDGAQVALTHRTKRGSPLKLTRPLAGPREDFQIGVDLELRYCVPVAGADLTASILATNLLDMENELQEVSGPAGINGRAALETQVPRAIWFTVTLAQPTASPGSSSPGGASR
jgi:hypothetical protein